MTKLLTEMEATGVIRPSKSPHASPVVIVTNKDGSLRLCVDYRKLNSYSTRDAFPLPRMKEALEALGQAKYFSTLDLTSGYWQVEVAEHDKHKTAFNTPMGLFVAQNALWVAECSVHLPETHDLLLWGFELHPPSDLS